MSELQFPLCAIALVSLVVKPSTEEITGFRKDGTPIIRRTPQETKPGEIFDIEDERMYRQLILEGYAELVDEARGPIEADD